MGRPGSAQILNCEPSAAQVHQAIQWLVAFESGESNESSQQGFQHWLQSSEMHQLAWQRLDKTRQLLPKGLPDSGRRDLCAEQALRSLQSSERRVAEKRRSLKLLASVSGLGVAMWLSRDYTGAGKVGRYGYNYVSADLLTAVGEQTQHKLTDGTELSLNTDTALDVDMQSRPQVTLRYGEIFVQLDDYQSQLQIRSGGNLIMPAAGAKLALRRWGDTCLLQLESGSAECLTPLGSRQLGAGQSLLQTPTELKIQPLNSMALSWRKGLLIAERTSLGDFIAQLSRYRQGYLGLDPALASLRLSGGFPLKDTDKILQNLSKILPIRQQRVSKYWVRLMPA